MPQKKYKHNSPFSLSVKRSKSGLGIFTNEPIKKKKFVIEYSGELISNEEADRRGGLYLFNINSRWTIDGKKRENLSRYLNHSCRPNCEAETRGKKVIIRSIKNIPAGEELTYGYGKEYFNEYIKPHGCRCQKCTNPPNKKRPQSKAKLRQNQT